MNAKLIITLCALMLVTGNANAWRPAEMKTVGDWQVEVTLADDKTFAPREVRSVLTVTPLEMQAVTNQRYEILPVFNPATAGWVKGERLLGVRAFECTTRYALDPASVIVSSGTGSNAMVYERGKDYDFDDAWGTLGRLSEGRIGAKQSVFLSYHYVKQRIDSVILTKTGALLLRPGEPHIVTPLPPNISQGELRVANIWLSDYRMKRLSADQLFPVLETSYPEPVKSSPTGAEQSLPKTIKALREGRRLKILAWGDSVTECGYLPSPDRWQAQFVQRLKKRFPHAEIELITEGWGGRNTDSFLQAPAGHLHNYQEKVLDAKPDLIVSEFVNDAGLTPPQVEARYGKLLADFQAIGAEWIILTPHYVAPDWMGLTRQREIDDDPRPYVKGLREFADRHHVALADAALRYGRLWRQGLPYSTLLTNTLNHPDARGMAIFADSLMALFP